MASDCPEIGGEYEFEAAQAAVLQSATAAPPPQERRCTTLTGLESQDFDCARDCGLYGHGCNGNRGNC